MIPFVFKLDLIAFESDNDPSINRPITSTPNLVCVTVKFSYRVSNCLYLKPVSPFYILVPLERVSIK